MSAKQTNADIVAEHDAIYERVCENARSEYGPLSTESLKDIQKKLRAGYGQTGPTHEMTGRLMTVFELLKERGVQ